jgi:transposase
MFIRTKPRPNGKISVQIVESYRRADQVTQKIVRHVGQAVNDREVEELKRLAQTIIVEMENQRRPLLPIFEPEEFFAPKPEPLESEDQVRIKNLREEQRLVEGPAEVFGKLYDDLGLGSALGAAKADRTWNDALKTLVVARLANPQSKLRTAALLEEDYAIRLPVEKIYRTLDRLFEREDEVKALVAAATRSLFPERVEALFFDVTTLAFESVEADGLREFGYSKDGKFKETQVTLALVTTTSGLPLTYELFPGNMYEGHTLVRMIEELKREYEVERVLLVADRAMFNAENLGALDAAGMRYIVAARLRSLPKELKRSILSDADFKAAVVGEELHWVKEYARESRRLIVSYSGSRAKKDAADRARLVERLLKKVKGGKVRLSDVIPNRGTKKFLKVTGGQAVVDEARIAADAGWDGLHGVITNEPEQTAGAVLERYRGLWRIEETFRLTKHDLKARPIYHWTEPRVRAHVLLCFVALAVAKQALHRLSVLKQSMSFERLRNELLHAQSSLVVDKTTGIRYLIPSHATVALKQIYHAFGLKRSEVPRRIL